MSHTVALGWHQHPLYVMLLYLLRLTQRALWAAVVLNFKSYMFTDPQTWQTAGMGSEATKAVHIHRRPQIVGISICMLSVCHSIELKRMQQHLIKSIKIRLLQQFGGLAPFGESERNLVGLHSLENQRGNTFLLFCLKTFFTYLKS